MNMVVLFLTWCIIHHRGAPIGRFIQACMYDIVSICTISCLFSLHETPIQHNRVSCYRCHISISTHGTLGSSLACFIPRKWTASASPCWVLTIFNSQRDTVLFTRKLNPTCVFLHSTYTLGIKRDWLVVDHLTGFLMKWIPSCALAKWILSAYFQKHRISSGMKPDWFARS